MRSLPSSAAGLALFAIALAAPVFAACGGGGADPLPIAGAPGTAANDGEGSRDPASDPATATPGSRPPADQPPTAAAAGPLFRASADHGDLASFSLDETIALSDGTLALADNAGHSGTDPQPSGYNGGSFYNGTSYRYGIVTSAPFVAAAGAGGFDSITPSFEAITPSGTWIHVKLAARIAGTWTKDYSLGVWASDTSTVRRHSVDGQDDADGNVATDTLTLAAGKTADALRITVVLFSQSPTVTPTLRAVSAIATRTSGGTAAAPLAPDMTTWGKSLDVPKRSQMIYPNGGEGWCSPTSTSMLLAYWSAQLGAQGLLETPPTAAKGCLDVTYAGTGNWPFNTAHAASMDGGRLHGMVTRLGSFAEVEQLVGAGIPVAISVSYGPGELGHSPISSTAGHLIVVRGFASNGDVVCNDPAFPDDSSATATYDRAELTKAWQHSMGTTYVVWPATKTLPKDPLGAF